MTKNTRIILAALLAMIAVSTLYVVVPISVSFVASHIFVCLSIIFIACSLIFFGKKKAKSVAGTSYVILAIGYNIAAVVFSAVGCLCFSGKWTIVGHVILLIIYLIITILTSIGSDHINQDDKRNSEKRPQFEKEKADYWK